jgi:hypothetical protein
MLLTKKLVKKYIKHLKYLEIKKEEERKRDKDKRRRMQRKGLRIIIGSEKLYHEGRLKGLKVSVLNLYLREKQLKFPKGMRKKGKLDLVTADIATDL